MEVLGQTEPIPFQIGEERLKMTFHVVSQLLDEMPILGRDFMQAYDVAIDIPARKMCIRNCSQRYFVEVEYETTGEVTKFDAIPVSTPASGEMTPHSPTATLCRIERKGYPGVPVEDTALDGMSVNGLTVGNLTRHGMTIGGCLPNLRGGHMYLPVLLTPGLKQTKKSIESRLEIRAEPVTETRVLRSTENGELIYKEGSTPKEVICSVRSDMRYQEPSEFSAWYSITAKDDEPIKDMQPLVAPTREVFSTKPPIEHLEKQMTPEQYERLNDICESYEDVFMQYDGDIGMTTLVKHEIRLHEGSEPFKEKPRRKRPDEMKMVREEARKMFACGATQYSESPFCSAIVMVKKKDGSLRFCVDFRKLNAMTVKDSYPLPRIDESLSQLGSCNYFTTMDVGSAFWQIPMEENAIPYTAFATPDAFYEFKRMPFGLCNAVATFQRLMTRAIADVKNLYGNLVLIYVDDILIATRTIDEHLDRLDEVFGILRHAGIKLKAKKCDIMSHQAKFLGRVVTKEGIAPNPENAEKIQTWEVPRNRKEIESFLGLACYYREYIEGFAEIVAPLNYLKKKGVEYRWGEEQDKAFVKVKEVLSTYPVLALPEDDGNYVLDTDAGANAIGGILHQWQDTPAGPKLRVISYGSRALRPAERNYSAPKAEMLAAITFIEKYQCFLSNKKFVLRCDNQALSWLKTYRMSTPMVARWITRLDGFHFEIEHRLRAQHMNADAMTKRPNEMILAENTAREVPETLVPGTYHTWRITKLLLGRSN
jgi:hypothetical protein